MNRRRKEEHPLIKGDDYTTGRLPMQAPLFHEHAMAKERPLFVEPFVGWRSWGVVPREDTLFLQSLSYKVMWLPGEELVSQCLNKRTSVGVPHGHSTPHRQHGCGIYAVKTETDALKWRDSQYGNVYKCYGEVSLWGTVFRYTKGYLSEKAYPKRVWLPHDIPRDFPCDVREAVHELRKNYRGLEVRQM